MDVTQPAITVSGPLTSRARVRATLTQNGFGEVDGDGNPTLIPDCTDGSTDPSVGFLTVHGEDLHRIAELLEPTNWALRAHWPGITRVSPLLDPNAVPLTEERVREVVSQMLGEQGRS